MQDFADVKRPKSSDYLYKNIPDFFLFNISFTLLISTNFLVNISIISELHNQAKTLSCFIYESFFVANHIRLIYWRKYTHFIQSILSFFFSEIEHFYLLKSIYISIR